jgi:hypothetical protein
VPAETLNVVNPTTPFCHAHEESRTYREQPANEETVGEEQQASNGGRVKGREKKVWG